MKIEFDIDLTGKGIAVNGVPCHIDSDNGMYDLHRAIEDYLRVTAERLDGTFNKGVFWPAELDYLVAWTLRTRYLMRPTDHFIQRAQENRLPRGCYTAMLYGEVVEAVVSHGRVMKMVTRLPNRMRPGQDICAAIEFGTIADQAIATAVTVWTNSSTDTHSTINKSKYVQNF